MNISSRFTEFGMTGAFFLLSQIAFFGLGFGQALVDFIPQWVLVWNGYQSMLPTVLQESAGSLLTVFGVIGIFIFGLILDLIGSAFSVWETFVFNRYLRDHQDWLDTLTVQCPKNIRDDYNSLRDHVGNIFIFTPKEIMERLRLVRRRKQIQSFLFSYIHVFSSLPDTLIDDMHLYRTSRSISLILLILAAELTFTDNSLSLGAVSIVAYLFLGLSAFFTFGSYRRMCRSLFSLACATQEKPVKA